MVGEGVAENFPPPDRSCAELWWDGAGLGAGVVSAASFSGRCREAGGEKGEALLEDVASRGRFAPTPLANVASAVACSSRSSLSCRSRSEILAAATPRPICPAVTICRFFFTCTLQVAHAGAAVEAIAGSGGTRASARITALSQTPFFAPPLPREKICPSR